MLKIGLESSASVYANSRNDVPPSLFRCQMISMPPYTSEKFDIECLKTHQQISCPPWSTLRYRLLRLAPLKQNHLQAQIKAMYTIHDDSKQLKKLNNLPQDSFIHCWHLQCLSLPRSPGEEMGGDWNLRAAKFIPSTECPPDVYIVILHIVH